MERSAWSSEAGTLNDPLGVKDKAAGRSEEAEDKHTGVVRFAEIAGRSFVNSAAQQPYNGLAQLVDSGTSKLGLGDVLPQMNIVSAPKAAKFGSSDWVAQTVGSGLGMVAPFMLSDGMLGAAGRGLGATKVGSMAAEMAESVPFASTLAPLARPALSGATYGFLFTPSADSGGKSLLWERTKSAAVGGLTFPAAKLGSEALGAGIAKGLSAVGVDVASNLAGKIALRGGSSVLGGGLGGGFANAESSSYLNTGHAASLDEVEQSVGSFAVTGGALEALGVVQSRFQGRGRESAVPPEGPAKTSAHSRPGTETPQSVEAPSTGGMADVQKRMESANGPKATSPFLVESSINLSKSIADKMNLRSESEMSSNPQWRDFTGLIEKTLAREHADAGTEASQLAGVLNSATRFLSSDQSVVPLTDGQKLGLVKQVLHESLHPQEAVNESWGAPIAGIQQTLMGHAPGKVAESVLNLLQTGKFESTLEKPAKVDLSDQTTSKLPEQYRNTLAPDHSAELSLQSAQEAGAPPVIPGQRSYYGQLAQLLALNIHAQNHHGGPFIIAHDGMPDGRPELFQAGADNQYVKTSNGEFDPWLSTSDLQRVYDHVSGVANESLVIKNGKPTFVTDTSGMLPGRPGDRPGLYVEDTRYLNKLDVTVNGNDLKCSPMMSLRALLPRTHTRHQMG